MEVPQLTIGWMARRPSPERDGDFQSSSRHEFRGRDSADLLTKISKRHVKIDLVSDVSTLLFIVLTAFNITWSLLQSRGQTQSRSDSTMTAASEADDVKACCHRLIASPETDSTRLWVAFQFGSWDGAAYLGDLQRLAASGRENLRIPSQLKPLELLSERGRHLA